ncbi:single-stranded DNA-binding protein [Paraburkholderia tuberum]|uniref:Single-strand binding protein family protein n=1 Tax=Paraburkholderia tuberum TaxID=157910 RepID=A0A1H0ZPE0_9BURK|nr:single-stranded DNA-binding protein [Paraburkholderia tuberum]SDQ29234.1 Single-strand binding protein family protein [Paraburkholderia tuberum]
MSIDALIAGKLFKTAEERRSGAGKVFVTAKVRAAMGDGESIFVNVIAFSDSAKAALLALDDGEAVALAGSLTPKVWTDRDGNAKPALDMVAAQVLTTYHVQRKRKAVSKEAGSEQRKPAASALDFDDDL